MICKDLAIYKSLSSGEGLYDMSKFILSISFINAMFLTNFLHLVNYINLVINPRPSQKKSLSVVKVLYASKTLPPNIEYINISSLSIFNLIVSSIDAISSNFDIKY
jgi:hypothetical protein